MSHVPYAGAPSTQTEFRSSDMRVYTFWKNGYDTYEIAKMAGWKEAKVHKAINIVRSSFLKRENPYRAAR